MCGVDGVSGGVWRGGRGAGRPGEQEDRKALTPDDTNEDRDWIIKKVLAAKLWDGEDAWRNSVAEIEGEVLCGEFASAGVVVAQGFTFASHQAS